ncbi:PLDc N-terminal domain-containing protein [Kocuria tytonicola]|uniref:PLDc N-terminal domain-containing protein n=1 Tax=Kocuria tytonicola TaxID=2055946 RepID=UPI001F0BABD3|nr:PLDc N-terminal domain-containing protein [Kocuria tytonicola]
MGRAIMIIGAGALAVGVIIYALIECAQSEKYTVRAIPKGAWLLVILLLPVVGALLWLFFGRPRNDAAREPARGRGPDDDPQFLRNLEERRRQQERARRLQEWENELKRTGRSPHRHDAAGGDDAGNGTARNDPLDPADPRFESRGPGRPESPGDPAEDTGNDPEPPHGSSPSAER